jgi:phosphohistidine phosphatase
MAKTLLLLRHAKSSWKDSSLDDHDRPLNQRGKAAAPRMGRLLRDEGLVPDLIVASTAVRAQATAFAVIEASGYAGPLRSARSLYLAPPSAYVELARELDERTERVLMIGHNPGIENLLSELVGRPEAMPTAALAALSLPVDDWLEFDLGTAASLIGFWRPRELE